MSFPQSRREEEEHLHETVEIVRQNVSYYRAEVRRMSSEVDTMLEHFHDDNPELYNVLENTITMNDNYKRVLFRNEQALKKAYFGRIDYDEDDCDGRECIYIGKGGISKDSAHVQVVDWRAPIAAAYYESSIGECFYTRPDGERKAISVTLKRTYEINGEQLIDFFDSETVSNDELLTKYLAKNKQAVLGEIIASIQKEQDDIIRKSPFWNVLVQGVAGSGKTTVAMHRISFILYNYPERFKAKDFYIIGSNHILLNYITGVLPELDVYGAGQMTMEELFAKLLYEDWDRAKYKIIPAGSKRESEELMEQGELEKGTSGWFFDLTRFCEEYEWKYLKRDNIVLNKKQFVQGFYNGTAGVHDISETDPPRQSDLVTLVTKDEVERYIRDSKTISMQSKVEMLNQKLSNRLENELTGKFVSYTDEEKKAIRRNFRSWYGKESDKHDIFAIYREFLKQQNENGHRVMLRTDEFDVYDLAALAYLYKRIKETDPIKEASHIVIDEAQDFGMMVYHSLKYCIPGCTYTIMGDVSQNIHFGYGLSDWEELKQLILTGNRDSFGILKKSYRNTVEISEFASNILRHSKGRAYVAEPVIRHGEEAKLVLCGDETELFTKAAAVIKEWQSKDYNTIAVICRNQKQADHVQAELGKLIPLQDNHLETAVFGTGVIVLPVEYTKGLEFDAVLIYEPNRESYPKDTGHAKLLYVAATRALHELYCLHCHPLTGLIADPCEQSGLIEEKAPEQSQPEIILGQDHDTTVIKDMHEREREKILLRAKPVPDEKRPADIFKKPVSEAYSMKAVRRVSRAGAEAESFGKRPLPLDLKQSGHTAPDQVIRWVEKRNDGVFLTSRQGVIRLCLLSSSCIRVTFVKGLWPDGQNVAEEPFQALKPFSKWQYKEKKDGIEIKTEAMTVFAEKNTGIIRYVNPNGRIILSDRAKESRSIEKGALNRTKAWQFFDWQRNESIFGVCDEDESKNFNTTDRAGYLSDAKLDFTPWMYSNYGYAIVILSKKKTLVCKMPAYGSFFQTEGEQLDYCVILGKSKEELEKRKAEAGL